MAFTAAQLAACEAAIVEIMTRGAAELEINGRRIRYVRLEDLIALRDLMEADVNAASYGASLPVQFDEAQP